MRALNQDGRWIQRGRQRQAVVQAIHKPMTGTEILERARAAAPQIQLRDVWFLLRQLTEKELAYCLTPRLVTGKLYFLTERGRATVTAKFKQTVPELTESIDWTRYALVVRGRIRRLVLEEIGRPRWQSQEGKTASEIRRHLVERKKPAGLNPTLRALADLTKLRLARSVPCSDRRRSKRYVLTPAGRRVVEQLQR